MNATTDSLAVVKARLPYTDRGSFSQAWFSALHLATDPAGRAPVARAHRPLDERARVASDAPARAVAERASERATGGVARRVAPTTHGTPDASDARLKRAPLTAKAGASPRPRASAFAPFGATLSLGSETGRIHVLVRREGEIMHVVALCSERNADVVRRALATTERGLRARGARVATSVRTFESEALP